MKGNRASSGVGGPVGSGKTMLIERVVPILAARGTKPFVFVNCKTGEGAEKVAEHKLKEVILKSDEKAVPFKFVLGVVKL